MDRSSCICSVANQSPSVNSKAIPPVPSGTTRCGATRPRSRQDRTKSRAKSIIARAGGSKSSSSDPGGFLPHSIMQRSMISSQAARFLEATAMSTRELSVAAVVSTFDKTSADRNNCVFIMLMACPKRRAQFPKSTPQNFLRLCRAPSSAPRQKPCPCPRRAQPGREP